MQVKDIMTTKVVSVKPATKVGEVAALLHGQHLSGLPVVKDDGTVVGLITEKQLFSSDAKLYLPGYIQILQETHFVIGGHKELPYVAAQLTRTKAEDIMNQDVYFTQPEVSAAELAESFGKYNQNPIPVVDHTNKLLGIVSRSDLIRLLVPSVPIHPGVDQAVLPRPHIRPIDQQLSYVRSDLTSRFAYVARARANIWLTTAVVLFVIGFVLGVIYVADPTVLQRKTPVNRTVPF